MFWVGFSCAKEGRHDLFVFGLGGHGEGEDEGGEGKESC